MVNVKTIAAAELSISRQTSDPADPLFGRYHMVIEVMVRDDGGRRVPVRIHVSMADFALAVTGMGARNCVLERRD